MSDDFMLELARLILTGLSTDALSLSQMRRPQPKRPRSLHFSRSFYNLGAADHRHMFRCIRGLQTVSDFGFTHVVNNQRLAEFRKKNVTDTSGLNFFVALHSTEKYLCRHAAWRSTG